MILTKQELEAIQIEITRFSDHLMEMGCESVRIITSVGSARNETSVATVGSGNWFAQIGSVRNWIAELDAQTAADPMLIPDEPEEGTV